MIDRGGSGDQWPIAIREIIDYDDLTTHRNDFPMSSITIRNLDPAVKERLRVRAAQHGRSMEAEVRNILQRAVSASGALPTGSFYERIHARFARLGGVDLELPPRDEAREPPRFD